MHEGRGSPCCQIEESRRARQGHCSVVRRLPSDVQQVAQQPQEREPARTERSHEKAEADYYAALEAIILKAGRERDWKAAAWLLERKRPQQYARRTVTAVIDEDVKPEVPRFYFDPSEAE